MNVEAIYMGDLHIDDEITYTEAEIDDMFRLHQEAVEKKKQFKMWCKEFLNVR